MNQFIYQCTEIQSKKHLKKLTKIAMDSWKKKQLADPMTNTLHLKCKNWFEKWHRLQEINTERTDFTKKDLYNRLQEQLLKANWSKVDRSVIDYKLICDISNSNPLSCTNLSRISTSGTGTILQNLVSFLISCVEHFESEESDYESAEDSETESEIETNIIDNEMYEMFMKMDECDDVSYDSSEQLEDEKQTYVSK